MTLCSTNHKKLLLPPQGCSFPLSTPCVLFSPRFLLLIYLCLFSSSSLSNWLCPSLLCWCCSDRKTHPPLATLSLPPWLSLAACSRWHHPCSQSASLPPPLFPPSLILSSPHSVDSDHSFIVPSSSSSSFLSSIQPSVLPVSSPSLCTVWSSCCYYCFYIHPCSAEHNNARWTLP